MTVAGIEAGGVLEYERCIPVHVGSGNDLPVPGVFRIRDVYRVIVGEILTGTDGVVISCTQPCAVRNRRSHATIKGRVMTANAQDGGSEVSPAAGVMLPVVEVICTGPPLLSEVR